MDKNLGSLGMETTAAAEVVETTVGAVVVVAVVVLTVTATEMVAELILNHIRVTIPVCNTLCVLYFRAMKPCSFRNIRLHKDSKL
jgi:hypothetical protein